MKKFLKVELKRIEALKEEVSEAIIDSAGLAFGRTEDGALIVIDEYFKAIYDELNAVYIDILAKEGELIKGLE